MLLSLISVYPSAAAAESVDPLRFFEGRTELQGTLKVMLRKPIATRTIGQGRIGSDGSLTLVQRVFDSSKPPHERRWHVRQIAPNSFTASMSQAVGPVAIDKIGERFRFRFKMKGNLNVEQWLTPLPGGKAAQSTVKVRRMGMTVATSSGLIRKIAG